MRVLFLHASWHHTSEYNVHRLLSENVDPQTVDCYFIWQDATHDSTKNVPPRLSQPNRTFYWDFGRDMGLSPKPSKARRALMMFSRLPSSLWFVARKIRSIQPDLLYTSQQAHEVALGNLFSLLFRIPHLIHISYPVGPWLGRNAWRTIKKTPHLIACSDFVYQGALQAGISPQYIETLLHGANLDQYDIPKNRLPLRQEFNWSPNTLVVTAAARLDPGKGHLLLLEAFAKVLRVIPETRLLLCGVCTTGTNYDQIIKQKAADLQLGVNVIFAGYRRDLPNILAGTDLFCLPTKNDALPLVFLAAMAAGVPTVACRSGGVPEMVIDQKTGLLSELGDAEALAANMQKLLRNKELAERMGAAGKTLAFGQFEPKQTAAKWAEILHRRLDGQR